ncbi:hypothetical protein, partial [Pseudooceanicola nanhaiensis]
SLCTCLTSEPQPQAGGHNRSVTLVAIEIALIAALISFPQLITWLPEMALGDADAPQLIQR